MAVFIPRHLAFSWSWLVLTSLNQFHPTPASRGQFNLVWMLLARGSQLFDLVSDSPPCSALIVPPSV